VFQFNFEKEKSNNNDNDDMKEILLVSVFRIDVGVKFNCSLDLAMIRALFNEATGTKLYRRVFSFRCSSPSNDDDELDELTGLFIESPRFSFPFIIIKRLELLEFIR